MTTSYSLRLKPSAEKDLRKLPKDIKLSNADRLFRIRIGEYRVIYEVETNAKQITVHHVRHRREAYRSL